MKIAISGANGFIGNNLVRALKKESHEIVFLSRKLLYSETELMTGLSGTNVVVHLAGAPILQRWTPKAKEEIMNSRVITTRNLTRAINSLPPEKRPKLFISASAIGIYSADGQHSEKSTAFADDFVGQVVQNWEKSSEDLDQSVRRVIFRIGLVLGNEAKLIRQLLPVFNLGLGGKIGSGEQPFPFIHIQDVIRAVLWATENTEVRGIYNLVAPQQITNTDFTKTLARLLHRPAIFSVPAFSIKLIFGKAATLILKNPNVYPERLLNSGFQYSFPDIHSCLQECIKKPR